MWTKIIKLISAKTLAAYLPQILAYILTKGLAYLLKKYPEKTKSVQEIASEIGLAVTATVAAAADGKFTTDELTDLQAKWKDVFVMD